MAKFKPGQSGNPKGRPVGIPNRAAKLRDGIDAGELIGLALDKARDGDVQALKLLLDRCLPPLRPVAGTVAVDLHGSLAEQGRAVLSAVGAGTLPPDTGERLLAALVSQGRLIESTELAERVAKLERGSKL
ncbi:MAG: hypothetical protein CVV12_08795 [Gammaproteobacteria bacterium HGW-Gammaproteobacteria-2]|jgi:hypothetical protein|nr:MAG: hypothetical protein CVV12_08795 [Gammaproteobacteria bacterium HGW-Gammaproteobacteria-2]